MEIIYNRSKMSKTDTCDGHWKPEDCSNNLRLVTIPVDAPVPAIRFQDCTIPELYCLQGTSKVLHPKPNISVRPAWTASGSVRRTTPPTKFIKGQKTSQWAQNRNNCRINDRDINYSACDTKMVKKQLTIKNVKNSKLSQFDCKIEEAAEFSTCDNKISLLNSQSKPNQDIINSSCAQKHSESQQSEPNQVMAVVEIYPGVMSYTLDVSSTNLDNQNISGGKKNNDSNIEEQLFDTLKKRPCPQDNAGMKSYSLDASPSYQDNSEGNQESPRVQTNQDNSEVNQSSESKPEEQLFCSLKECPNPPDSTDDDIAVSWYRNIVERELELYLKKLRSKVTKRCPQQGDTTQPSASARQNAQQSKTADSIQMYEISQSRRISRTARYVNYLLWKDSTAKCKDRLDIPDKPKFWKPT